MRISIWVYSGRADSSQNLLCCRRWLQPKTKTGDISFLLLKSLVQLGLQCNLQGLAWASFQEDQGLSQHRSHDEWRSHRAHERKMESLTQVQFLLSLSPSYGSVWKSFNFSMSVFSSIKCRWLKTCFTFSLLGIVPQTNRCQVEFLVRAHA